MSWSWWPENGDGQEHEAWVQPIFHDGEEGTGTSNATGIIFDCYTPAERVRPYCEVAELRIICSCGWTGPRWNVDELPRWAVDTEYREPTDYGEQRLFLPDWQAHLAPLKAADADTCPTCGRHR